MTEPVWLTQTMVDAIQRAQIREHGGQEGVRDPALVQSALGRPQNRWHYQPDSDLPALAASFGFGLATNHPYLDGNKRVAFMAMYVFLGLNNLRLVAPETEAVDVMLALASSALDEASLADWLRGNVEPA